MVVVVFVAVEELKCETVEVGHCGMVLTSGNDRTSLMVVKMAIEFKFPEVAVLYVDCWSA